jgi:hypothetical protein
MMALPILLVLLIVVKGFGWPLLCVLLVILVALILKSIEARRPAYADTTALGLLALVFVSMGLFWGALPERRRLAQRSYETVEIHPSGLLAQRDNTSDNPPDIEVRVQWADWRWQGNPLYDNLYRRAGVLNALCLPFRGSEHVLRCLGIVDYIRSRKWGNCYVNDGGYDDFEFAHLDYVDGQLVYRHNDARHRGPAFPWNWERATIRYIGSQGVSDVPTHEIGCFAAPLVGASEFVENRAWWPWGPARHDLNTFTLFEAQSGCFFSVDLGKRIVSGGPELGPRSDEPVQVAAPCRRDLCRIEVRRSRSAQSPEAGNSVRSPYVPVVCESGQIELLDRETLEIVGIAGAIPRPPTLFDRGSRKPHDVLASDVAFIAVDTPHRNTVIDRPERGDYVGAVTASVSRQGTSMNVAVFDGEGKLIESPRRQGGLALNYMATKYVFESLHPPILTLASFFTAYSFEAGSTHRALFLMPNSFVALQRDRETGFIFQFLFALLFLLPPCSSPDS